EQLENFIDNCPPIRWDYILPPDNLKNPNAEIPNIENNKEWVKYLYKHILNMDMPEDDTGLSGWVKSLENGMPRNDIVNYFRQVANQENEKIQQQSQNQNT